MNSAIKSTSPSERLAYLLQGSDFSSKHGQIQRISQHTGYTRSAVKRWLETDAMPRCPKERIEVAKKLGVDLIFWEYGIEYTTFEEKKPNEASIYRAIFKVVDEKESHTVISEADMKNIKEIIKCASNQKFFQDLVELVEHLVDLTVKGNNNNST